MYTTQVYNKTFTTALAIMADNPITPSFLNMLPHMTVPAMIL